MYSNIVTSLTLIEWANIMGMEKYGMSQIHVSDDYGCSDVLLQSGINTNFNSRDGIAGAIRSVESKWLQNIGYNLVPTYEQAKISVSSPDTTNMLRIKARNKITSIGKQTRTLIGEFPTTIAEDGSFTIEFTDTEDRFGYMAYFISADRGGRPIADRFRIRPLQYIMDELDGTAYGIHETQLITPSSLSSILEYTLETAVYAEAVEIYGIDVDTSDLGTVQFANGVTRGILSVDLLDDDLGWMDIYFNGGVGLPINVIVNIESGQALSELGGMDDMHAAAIARCSAGHLASLQMGCDSVRKNISYWGALPSSNTEDGRDRPMTVLDVENVFGEHRGAVEARNLANANIYP